MNSEMNCDQIKPALLEYLMEEAPAPLRGVVESHVRHCESCSQEMAELQRTMTFVRRAEVSEEMPRRIRIVAEPASPSWAFWRNPARLAFAGAGLLCLAIALLATFGTTISYQNGNFQIAFGASAVSSGAPLPASVQPAALDRAQVSELISEALRSVRAERERQSGELAQEVAQKMDERWRRDLGDLSAGLRMFQAAQTTMWKEQVQNQQLVSALVQRSGLPSLTEQ